LDYQDPPVTVRVHIGVLSAIAPLDRGTGRFTAVIKKFIGTLYPNDDPVASFDRVFYWNHMRSGGFQIRVAFGYWAAGFSHRRRKAS
jgi:dipeptide/tripeptide permease